MITREWLLERFIYNPLTGHINHKPNPIESYGKMRKHMIIKRLRGERAEVFRERKKGCSYYAIIKGNKAILAHRAAYWMHYGELPDFIDHINGNTFDNRICNLRACTRLENNRNCSVQKNNKSGYPGVRKVRRKYVAMIGVDNKNKYLGTFDSFEEAKKARKNAERELGYSINHGERDSQQKDDSIEKLAMAEVNTSRNFKSCDER